MSSSREVREGYVSTLADLTCNSKPLINVLTILADENIEHAADIVATIESHLEKVRKDIKLPVLYLIDCIMKNVGGTYLSLFSQNIIPTFCHVFEVVDEKTRAEMFKLRQTWNDVLPKSKLYSLDVKINQIDPAWPIVVPPVTNNIHLNPKFLQNTTLPKKSPPISLPAQELPQPIMPPDAGLTTLDMQKKLLMKQQQLLELQQKRLELEVLQTQVKLQERMTLGNGTPNTEITNVTKPQNILLKPEVAKQLAGAGNSTKNTKQLNSSAIMNKRLQQNQGSGGITTTPPTRIAPVNSALVAAASGGRPTRDPRLIRHQNAAATAPANNITTVSSNVQIENKSNITTETLGSNTNKSFNNNKASVQGNSRSDPRSQVSSKSSASPPNQTKSKTLTQSPTKKASSSTSSKEKQDKSDKLSVLFSVKLGRSSRTIPKSTSSTSSRGSTSSLDSPSKGKSGKGDSKAGRSASASPTKHKKKDTDKVSEKLSRKTLGEKMSKAPSSALTSSSSSSSSINNFSKSDKESKTLSPVKQLGEASSPSTFKEFKSSAKSRNYIRRNRDLSVSPEPAIQDVDLRLSGPAEKQPRLQNDISDDKGPAYDLNVTGMDIDLRQLPAMVSKKRSSTDLQEPVVAKKTKTEVFDELFGNEDTDLRQLTNVMTSPPTQDRPPTPPPPIISSKAEDDQKSEKVKNLDILRAKLANATNRNKIRSKQEQKQKEDTDLRGGNSIEDSVNRIIISSADEQCIKTGNMTKEQEKALMNKILAQMENQKLNEAKRKDNEENLGNISLQPISDDELEADFSCSSDEETAAFRRNVYVDKDDRVPPTTQMNNEYNNKYPLRTNDRGDLRRGLWRGRSLRGRGMIRGGLRNMRPGDAWARPMNGPWKPMQSSFMKPPIYNNEIIDLDNIEQEQSTENAPHELVVDCVNQDNTKSINIDGYPRDIRYYDETAIIFMSWDDSREISFQNGSRKIIFGDKDIYILSFNEPYKEVLINGGPHNVKLGAPTREIYVDGKYYECFFGGPQVLIDLDGKLTSLKMEGPPPQVKIGTNTRRDLVAGQINLIIDAKTVVPVFLDGKVQKFEIEGKVNTLKFIDALKTVLINDVPFHVEYGGLPKPILVQDRKHFIRFTRLPRGVHPGIIKIKDMEGNSPESPRHDSENSLDTFPIVDPNEPALPVLSKKRKNLGIESPERNSNSPVPNLFQQSGLSNLDNMLSSVMASNLLPTNSSINTNNGYQVENIHSTESQQQAPQQDVPNVPQTTVPPPVLPSTWNINDLFQKLVASGIMTTLQEQTHTADVNTQAKPVNINPNNLTNNTTNAPPIQKFPLTFGRRDLPTFYKAVNFDKPETLKMRQSTLIHALYSGMPCSSCGMRFPPEQSMQYSQHLDWHFRQNRKGKKNIRKAASRRWYYSLSDWKNYEEIEDLEEREKSYFENQQQAQAEGADEAEEEVEIPSVPADPNIQDPRCEVCHDRFDQFYNEEKEEWHLKQAICVDGLNYHPLCYEDYQSSLVETTLDDSAVEKEDENTQDSLIPGLDTVILDKNDENTSEIVIDDDESEKLTEISENTKDLDKEDVTQSAFPDEDDGDDDDVIINEVVPEKIDLVDDDKYDDEPDNKDSEPVIQIKEEPIDDGFMDVDGGIFKVQDIASMKIKSEPIDPDELATEDIPSGAQDVETLEDRTSTGKSEAHPTDLVMYIDGNVEFDSNVQPTSGISGKIKINITKPLPVIAPKESSTNKELSSEIERGGESIDPSQPLPPGEEPVQLNIKPALQGVNLKKLPPVKKGSELSGLCSIM